MQRFVEDRVSLGAVLCATGILIYLGTFLGFSTLLFMPMVLLFMGISLQWYLGKKIEHDETTDLEETSKIGFYTLVALGGFGIASLTQLNLFKPVLGVVPLQIGGELLYGQLYAISEEIFFRGGLTYFFAWQLKSRAFASIAGGVTFSLYHLHVYAASVDSLLYVAIAGTILSYIVLRSGRISPAIAAHCINNAIAVGLLG
jgi:membrane protease YdiL (CAAX protease family)